MVNGHIPGIFYSIESLVMVVVKIASWKIMRMTELLQYYRYYQCYGDNREEPSVNTMMVMVMPAYLLTDKKEMREKRINNMIKRV